MAAAGAIAAVVAMALAPASRAAWGHAAPAGLGTYMLHDQDARLVSVDHGRVTRAAAGGPASEWAPAPTTR
jgi:hypothetical protein